MSTDKPKPLGTVERDEHAWMETVKFLDAWNGPTHIVAQAFETLKIDPIPVLAVELPGTGEGVYFTREMLASFIAHAQAWLATGSLEIPPAPPSRPYGEHAAMPEPVRECDADWVASPFGWKLRQGQTEIAHLKQQGDVLRYMWRCVMGGVLIECTDLDVAMALIEWHTGVTNARRPVLP